MSFCTAHRPPQPQTPAPLPQPDRRRSPAKREKAQIFTDWASI